MSRLSDALRKRFATPRAALRALGLDESLFDELAHDASRVRRRRSMAMDHIVGKPHPRHPDWARDEEGGLPDKVETMTENLTSGAEDEEEDDDASEAYGPLRQHLRESGMDEEAVEEATKLAKDFVRTRARDRMPRNRLSGGRGGHFGGSRNGRDEVAEIGRQLERVKGENGIAPGPGQGAQRARRSRVGRDGHRADASPACPDARNVSGLAPDRRRERRLAACAEQHRYATVRPQDVPLFGKDRSGLADVSRSQKETAGAGRRGSACWP